MILLIQRQKESTMANMEDMHFQIGLKSTERIIGTIKLFSERNFAQNEDQKSRYVKNDELIDTFDSKKLCILRVPRHDAVCDIFNRFSTSLSTVKIITRIEDEVPLSFITVLEFLTVESSFNFYQEFTSSKDHPKIFPIASILYNSNNLPKEVIELPTCPVCLDRLDPGDTGLIFTPACNHSIHGRCFCKWQTLREEPTCPVCRFSQFSSQYEEQEDESECGTCRTKKDLWLCLVCGHVGCGRYSLAHAKDHYHASNHAYAVEVNTQRVWDYVGEGYVHRLVRNNTDGKIVELPDPNHRSYSRRSLTQSPLFDFDVKSSGSPADRLIRKRSESDCQMTLKALEAEEEITFIKRYCEEKMERMYTEYSELLTSQLEAQKQYFENLLEETSTLPPLERERKERLIKENDKAKQERKRMSKKLNSLQKEQKKIEDSNKFLKDLNKTLLTDQKKANESIVLLRTENEKMKKLIMKQQNQDNKINDLEEQVKDLMFYIDTQNKIKKKKKDLQGASIVLE